MRARRLIAAAVLTAAALSSTVAGLAITGTLDKAFAASPPQCKPVSGPVSPPVSGSVQNPGQTGQNSGQKGQNTQCQPPPPSTTVISPVSGATLDSTQGYELAAVTSPGATGVTFEFTIPALGGVFTTDAATQDLSGTWVLDVLGSPPACIFPGLCTTYFTDPAAVQSVATFASGVSVTSPAVDIYVNVYCPVPDCA